MRFAASTNRTLTFLRIGWVALILFLFPLFAHGQDTSCLAQPELLDQIPPRAETHFPAQCKQERPPQAQGANPQAMQSAMNQEAQVCDAFIRDVKAAVAAAKSSQGSFCAAFSSAADKLASLQTNPKLAADNCKEAASTAQDFTTRQASIEKILANLKAEFKFPNNRSKRDEVIAQFNQAVAIKGSTASPMAEIKRVCGLNGVDLDQLERQAKEDSADRMQKMQMMQMASGALQGMMNTLKGSGDSKGSAGAATDVPAGWNDNSVLAGLDPSAGAGGTDYYGSGGNGLGGNGSGNSKDGKIALQDVAMGNGIGLAVGAATSTQGPPASAASAPANGSIGAASIDSATGLPISELSNNSGHGSGGTGGAGASAGGASGALGGNNSGASRAPASGEVGAAEAGSEGGSHSGGGGAGGGGGGSGMLGLTGDSGGLGDLMGGFKNPLDTAKDDASGSGVMNLAMAPPNADPRLSHAPELDKNKLDQSSVFSQISRCIRKQRELGNTR